MGNGMGQGVQKAGWEVVHKKWGMTGWVQEVGCDKDRTWDVTGWGAVSGM